MYDQKEHAWQMKEGESSGSGYGNGRPLLC